MYRYRCDIFQGNDGSPLYSETMTDPLRGRSVYGVVTDERNNWNLGVRFDKFRFCQLVLWIADSGYNPVCGNRPNCGCSA
jgi:V8-like Glu-specific endopeptidase